jgi:hypothetical protein
MVGTTNRFADAAESGKTAPPIPWIALDAGHFKKHGLEVELIHASSITALHSLLAGEVAVAQSVTDGVKKTILEGIEKLPGAKTADPHRFIDSTILDELEKEGFLKTLYRN